jgi:hypothetical protein
VSKEELESGAVDTRGWSLPPEGFGKERGGATEIIENSQRK